MIRRYCDICGQEVRRDYTSDRLLKWDHKIGIQITLGFNKTWNDGDFCLTCIQQAVNKLIDKTRTEERTL